MSKADRLKDDKYMDWMRDCWDCDLEEEILFDIWLMDKYTAVLSGVMVVGMWERNNLQA
jgi:hypothetical protein